MRCASGTGSSATGTACSSSRDRSAVGTEPPLWSRILPVAAKKKSAASEAVAETRTAYTSSSWQGARLFDRCVLVCLPRLSCDGPAASDVDADGAADGGYIRICEYVEQAAQGFFAGVYCGGLRHGAELPRGAGAGDAFAEEARQGDGRDGAGGVRGLQGESRGDAGGFAAADSVHSSRAGGVPDSDSGARGI